MSGAVTVHERPQELKLQGPNEPENEQRELHLNHQTLEPSFGIQIP